MKRQRNPSADLIASYGKKLPYIVAALDKSTRYADGTLSVPPWWDHFGSMPTHISPKSSEWLHARRNILIKIATVIIRVSWINKSMERNKKSPYVATIVEWFNNHSIHLPEDIQKTRDTLLEFHEGVLSGLIKGDEASIGVYRTQQGLAQYLKQLRGFLLKGGGYETLGCVRVAELEKYVLFRIDDHKTAEEAFRDTNWCVRAPDQFAYYKPPYFMVVNTNVPAGHDDRVCLMHDGSKQIKDVSDRPLSTQLQRALKPFLEFVFGRWACKYNMTDGDSGDLSIGTSWWPLASTNSFAAVEEILDILWAVGGELADISEAISTTTQDQFYDDARAAYKEEHPEDEDDEGFEDWFAEWGDSAKGNRELGQLEDFAIQECSYLTRMAFDIFSGLLFDAACGMDVAVPQIFGTSWDKLKKFLAVHPCMVEKTSRAGNKYNEITGFRIGGNPRFNHQHAVPKMEAWAERSIDNFIALLPSQDAFGRRAGRDQSVWGSLPGAKV